jgi:uncharacterized protein (UPF0332 family)
VRAAFHRVFVVEERLIERRIGTALLRLYQGQVDADYFPEVDISPERAQQAVALAEEIITTVQRVVR